MRLFYTLLVISFLYTPISVISQNFFPEKIASKLIDEMAAAPDAYHSVHVVLNDQVDLASLDEKLSVEKALPSRRSEAVIAALKAKASATQGSLLQFINNSPLTNSGTVSSLWIANSIVAELKNDLIAELSHRPEVLWIGINAEPKLEAYIVSPAPPPIVPNGREMGLTVIGAPAMWAMGYTGYGQIALTNDTGVDPTRPALSSNYLGNRVPAEQAFFDYSVLNQAQLPGVNAFDCDLHGTHVTGTILGVDRLNNDTIGVAFNSQWMGAASIVCNGGTAHILATFQWSMDPDGNPSTADDMPAVINNSWYDSGLDTLDCFSVYVPVLEALEAAGIAVVFSAGNAGPGASTITPPKNVNLNLVNSFTVGALNGTTSSFPIAGFSSRGPSLCVVTDSSLIIKPEVSAPGVDVRSCTPEGYDFLSGTSMAAPHVSGAICLLKEAFPNLPGKELKLALYFSAIDLGEPGEDNTYGMGIINLPAAFDYLVAQGNVPADPHVNHDVFVVDLQLPAITCEEEVSQMILTVENGGSIPLTSFDILYQAGASSDNLSWVGHLEQSERATIQLPALATNPGDYRFKVTLLNPNGMMDDRPLNNSIEKDVTVLDRKRLQVQPEGAAVACEGASVLIRAEYDGPGYASVNWYDEPSGGTPIAQGTVFETQPLAVADTFYAEASYILPVGPTDKDFSANQLLTDDDIGLVFDATQPFKLKSVKVYASQSGLRQFLLRDESGVQLKQTVVSVPAGESYVNLNWDIPASNDLQILKGGGKDLFGNPSGASFPYTQPGWATITGNTLGNNSYYYFYDWQIEIPEICERTQIIVPVSGQGNSPGASFSLSADSLDLTDNQPIQFTNTSTGNIASYDWNFGDGTGSTAENPAHQYTEPGTYIVSLAITSLEGCASFALDTIEVTKNGISNADPGGLLPANIAVYPNPSNQFVNVQLNLPNSKMVELQLSDLTGKTVRTKAFLASQSDLVQLDIADLSTGVYFLLVKMEGENSAWKVVKI